MKRVNTRYSGVFYRESTTNGKKDKTYYIRFKDDSNKDKELKIGKYSEGVREAFCNQKRNEYITKIRLGEEPPAILNKKAKKIITIENIAKGYFQQRENKRSKQTDLSNYNNYIFPFFKSINTININRDQILDFTNYLKICKNSKGKNLADKSINNILNLLKTIIKYGYKFDHLKNDLSKYIKLLDIDNARERFLSKEEINILFNHTSKDERIFLIYKLALNTGGRLSSILNISKKDIDFTHDLLTLKDFKNNTTYKAFLTEELKTLLENYMINNQIKTKLFKSNPERRLREILNNLFNSEIEEDDRKNKVVFHTLRHTFASHLAINGTPIFTIQKLMNHKDIKMTLRYAKLNPDSGREAIKSLFNF